MYGRAADPFSRWSKQRRLEGPNGRSFKISNSFDVKEYVWRPKQFDIRKKVEIKEEMGRFKHRLTHRAITALVFRVEAENPVQLGTYVSWRRVEDWEDKALSTLAEKSMSLFLILHTLT